MGWNSNKTLNLYSAGVQYVSQLGHHLYWLRFSVVFVSPPKQITSLDMTTSSHWQCLKIPPFFLCGGGVIKKPKFKSKLSLHFGSEFLHYHDLIFSNCILVTFPPSQINHLSQGRSRMSNCTLIPNVGTHLPEHMVQSPRTSIFHTILNITLTAITGCWTLSFGWWSKN
jgi:hypothetical protein